MTTEKKNVGRPEVPELLKLRRRAKRSILKLEELTFLAETELEIDESHDKPKRGRPRLSVHDKYMREKENYQELMRQIRAMEAELGEEHIDPKSIDDPILDELGRTKVGRPARDEFTVLDHELVLAMRKLEKAESIPEELEQPSKGRKRITRDEAVRKAKIEIMLITDKIEKLESELDDLGLQERKIKKLRDQCRLLRFGIKKSENEQEKIALEHQLEVTEETLREELNRMKFLQQLEDKQSEISEIAGLLAKAKRENDPEKLKLLRKERVLLQEEQKIKIELAAMKDTEGLVF